MSRLKQGETARDVFISYASVDAARVLPVTQALQSAGVLVWRDAEKLRSGMSYNEKIVQAIKQSKVLLLMCSPHAFASDNVHQEVMVTWESAHRQILPVWLTAPMPMREIPDRFQYCLAGKHHVVVRDSVAHDWLPELMSALTHFGVSTQLATNAPTWTERILSFARKYGKPAGFVAKLALQTFLPGAPWLGDLAGKVFEYGSGLAQETSEASLQKLVQENSSEVQRLAEVLGIFQDEMGELLTQVSALQSQPDRAKELLTTARTTDRNVHGALAKLDALTERFDHVETQNDRLLQGQEEILFWVKQMAAGASVSQVHASGSAAKPAHLPMAGELPPSPSGRGVGGEGSLPTCSGYPPSPPASVPRAYELPLMDSRDVARREQRVWLQRLNQEASWCNAFGVRFRLAPAGRFRLGAGNADPLAQADEKPAQTVTIAKPFWAATFPVTNETIRHFLEDADGAEWQELLKDRAFAYRCRNGEASLDAPAVEINAHDAVTLCRWMTAQDGRRYRLPTEAEWEYLARAGAVGLYWWEEGLPAQQRAVFAGKGPVAQDERRANGWGVCDPLGNVAEWTMSEYGPMSSGMALKVADHPRSATLAVRGGSWRDPLEHLRLSRRLSMNAGSRKDWLGVRLVCDIEIS